MGLLSLIPLPNSRPLTLETHTWFVSNLHTRTQGLAWFGGGSSSGS